MSTKRNRRGLLRLAVALQCAGVMQRVSSASSFPQIGIHSGHNRIAWPSGCCNGDLVIIIFRDEQGDGNLGEGLLEANQTIANNTPAAASWRLEGELGYTWKTYGPFCVHENWHNLSYTSDANPDETSYEVWDSYGLLKAKGGMLDFPASFHVLAPSKFCSPSGGLSAEQQSKRNRKLLAANDQRTPRNQLVSHGWAVPQDVYPPLTVYDNSG